jgi:hypothetical protein
MHHYLKTETDQVLGLRLDASILSDEFYDVLAWADDRFPSYFVKQTDDHVYVCADTVKEMDASDRTALHTAPLAADGAGPTAADLSEDPTTQNDQDDSGDDGAVTEPTGL